MNGYITLTLKKDVILGNNNESILQEVKKAVNIKKLDPEYRLTKYLISNRLKKTPERFEILKAVIKAKDFTAYEIYKEMEVYYKVSFQTIYNTFDILEKSNIIIKKSKHRYYAST